MFKVAPGILVKQSAVSPEQAFITLSKARLPTQAGRYGIPVLAGATVGGLGGYMLTPEEEKYYAGRNALVGALGGAGLGAGIGFMRKYRHKDPAFFSRGNEALMQQQVTSPWSGKVTPELHVADVGSPDAAVKLRDELHGAHGHKSIFERLLNNVMGITE